MPTFEDLSFSFEDFSGTVRLFPLPNLVLFPHVMQPLHVFEPRYRELLEDALNDDRLIAMAVLSPGWEDDYEGRPTLLPHACLGRITSYHRLPDGTYNVLLLGLRRVRLVRELPSVQSFRKAEVEVCEDCACWQSAESRRAMQQRLHGCLLKILPALPDAREQLDQLLETDVSLGVLTDVIGYMLDMGVPRKQALLAELDVYQRARMLLDFLSSTGLDDSIAVPFPPQFSMN